MKNTEVGHTTEENHLMSWPDHPMTSNPQCKEVARQKGEYSGPIIALLSTSSEIALMLLLAGVEGIVTGDHNDQNLL